MSQWSVLVPAIALIVGAVVAIGTIIVNDYTERNRRNNFYDYSDNRSNGNGSSDSTRRARREQLLEEHRKKLRQEEEALRRSQLARQLKKREEADNLDKRLDEMLDMEPDWENASNFDEQDLHNEVERESLKREFRKRQ